MDPALSAFHRTQAPSLPPSGVSRPPRTSELALVALSHSQRPPQELAIWGQLLRASFPRPFSVSPVRGADQCGLPVHTSVCVVLHPGNQASLLGQDLRGSPSAQSVSPQNAPTYRKGSPIMSGGSGWGPVSGGLRTPAHLQARPHSASLRPSPGLPRIIRVKGPRAGGHRLVRFPILLRGGGTCHGSWVGLLGAPWCLQNWNLGPPPSPPSARPTHPGRMVRTVLDWLPGPAGFPTWGRSCSGLCCLPSQVSWLSYLPDTAPAGPASPTQQALRVGCG